MENEIQVGAKVWYWSCQRAANEDPVPCVVLDLRPGWSRPICIREERKGAHKRWVSRLAVRERE